ncbi:STM4011 family radical SAM protein [Deinococcus altitudinis]|uniref:STM4011 family radical SAM protein n=1 Tax=Deinococcus altitudinis TaxID=468914 RepID=UPI003892BB35
MEVERLSVLYRGPLSSCNYGCPYCPFAKHTETAAEHEHDRLALDRFVAWVQAQPYRVSVFFTPWGEALVRPRYQQALVALSRAPNVEQVAIQTNLSGPLAWTADAERGKLGLWATYHPGEVTPGRFLERTAELERAGVRYSVGMVGEKRSLEAIEAMRAALPPHVYLWVNAFKVGEGYYSAGDLARLRAVDPLFELNTRRYRVRGQPCGAGETVVSVEGDGTARRCHFIERPLGNVYQQDIRDLLRPRVCSRSGCECHIGYVHLPELRAAEVFGDGLLARIPDPRAWADPARFRALLERGRALGAPPATPDDLKTPATPR